MTCFYCKGPLEQELSAFTAELRHCIVVIKNVPTEVCEKCGQSYHSHEVVGRIEEITDSFRDAIAEVALVKYESFTVA